jgi:hypothetical protein
MVRRLISVVAAFTVLAVLGAAPARAASDAPQLFAGQSTQAARDDDTSFAHAPAGGSVYYEPRSGDWVSAGQRSYATFLASQGKSVQVGVSWKENPPGFAGGDENAKAARSRQVTAVPRTKVPSRGFAR